MHHSALYLIHDKKSNFPSQLTWLTMMFGNLF